MEQIPIDVSKAQITLIEKDTTAKPAKK